MKRELGAFAVLSSLSVLGVACEKKPENGGVAGPDQPVSTSSAAASSAATSATSATATTTAAVAATASGTTSTASTASTAAATATASGASSASAALNAKKDGGASSATALKPASKRVSGKNFSLDVASPGCRAGEDCTMTIKLSTAGDYHVNKEYPYKFLATAAPNVTFLGKADPNTFAKANGDFVEQGEKAGLMTVRFKPASAGEAKVAGKYKMSVCSADQCQIEEEMIDLAVPVM